MADEKKYQYEYHDGDDWLRVEEFVFDTAIEAKKAGVDAGFEYVRVVSVPALPAGASEENA